jgi:hypothetical protein
MSIEWDSKFFERIKYYLLILMNIIINEYSVLADIAFLSIVTVLRKLKVLME